MFGGPPSASCRFHTKVFADLLDGPSFCFRALCRTAAGDEVGLTHRHRVAFRSEGLVQLAISVDDRGCRPLSLPMLGVDANVVDPRADIVHIAAPATGADGATNRQLTEGRCQQPTCDDALRSVGHGSLPVPLRVLTRVQYRGH